MGFSVLNGDSTSRETANGDAANGHAVNGDGHAENGDAVATDLDGTNGDDSDGDWKTDTTGTSTTETKEETKDETKSDEPVGSVSTVKNLYKGPEDDDGDWTWVDRYPEDVEEAAENEETKKFALIVRNKKSNDSRKTLEADSIIIQSPWLRKALAAILADYTGVSCELERLEFDAPFEPFVHRWAEYTKYMQRSDLDDKTKEHLVLLHDILKYEIGDNLKAFEDYVLNGVITFDHLWMIFQPGAVVLSMHDDHEGGTISAFELKETDYRENSMEMKIFALTCDCVDWDGRNFGRSEVEIEIGLFIGTKSITQLFAYPLVFHKDKEGVQKKLEARGKMFEDMAGIHYKNYTGAAMGWDCRGNPIPIQCDGRIILDAQAFTRWSPYSFYVSSDWTAKDIEMMENYQKEQGIVVDENTKSTTKKLTPYHHMIAKSRGRGYSFRLKIWLSFYFDQISDITWDEGAFDKLVLPADQKELIHAISESQLSSSSAAAFDDVISGKGRGFICLLSGPPGVGKTLTAEAVAEDLRVPLHTLSSGDLGSDPERLDKQLRSVLEMVARWKAVLLLDECDVFLEARTPHDLERNKVVSIFLRTLEYYEGILFMTTNRVGNIDAAFQSRIHVSFEYPGLTNASRQTIWRNFLDRAGRNTDVSDAQVEVLARLDLNGRQIKNVLKTASLLASRKNTTLKREHIDTILAIQKHSPLMQASHIYL
ncbi:uncharacterized protein E0L32_006712 [Thyridium curvatum]|uniref:AAA+ ATPase domain-containing protein n=1 Tax=Thyridium curvatum TaxID=1093900 RepID=A0A507AS58_9PEZI|nr:uncharacterized protein E0L32_006712 [Thyridium curvatum]TPX12832.1 hypothetical protein E0L32_006712 [Thyridium curvatum]